MEYGSQRQQIETSDVVRSKYEQALSSDGDKILHQPESLQKSATEKSDIELHSVAKPYSVGFSKPAVVIMTDQEPALTIDDNGQRQIVTDSALIGQDLWKQLKRVTIPVFSGEKKIYQYWKAAFVDQATATPEHKLLQLRQCLAGEALKVIESLDTLQQHSKL